MKKTLILVFLCLSSFFTAYTMEVNLKELEQKKLEQIAVASIFIGTTPCGANRNIQDDYVYQNSTKNTSLPLSPLSPRQQFYWPHH